MWMQVAAHLLVLFSLDAAVALQIPRPVITPSGNPTRWDAACVANPVVLPPTAADEDWRCFYYGNRGGYNDDDGGWAGGVKCFLPTGYCGLATSSDGVEWTPVDGKNADKSIFGPGEPDAWDGLHVGVGDVVRLSNGTLIMFYLGGSNEAVPMGPAKLAGVRMQIGRAMSDDGGLSWQRCSSKPLIEAEPTEGLFASWPRVLTPAGEGGEWLMTYHAFNGSHWNVFRATSSDMGLSWVRQGRVLAPGDADAFDSSGIGTRAMCEWRDQLLMIFEGVGGDGKHRLGAAVSADGGVSWDKMQFDTQQLSAGAAKEASDPGGPILSPGGAAGAWTAQVVGTPYLVPMADGSLRLFHCAKTTETNMSIGLLESPSGDVSVDAWRPLC